MFQYVNEKNIGYLQKMKYIQYNIGYSCGTLLLQIIELMMRDDIAIAIKVFGTLLGLNEIINDQRVNQHLFIQM